MGMLGRLLTQFLLMVGHWISRARSNRTMGGAWLFGLCGSLLLSSLLAGWFSVFVSFVWPVFCVWFVVSCFACFVCLACLVPLCFCRPVFASPPLPTPPSLLSALRRACQASVLHRIYESSLWTIKTAMLWTPCAMHACTCCLCVPCMYVRTRGASCGIFHIDPQAHLTNPRAALKGQIGPF